VIAADYGAHHARAWGWPIHLVVGDLDSLPAGEAAALKDAAVPVLIAPQAKDETDLELALALAFDLGPDEVVICAALGGRVDHLLANVLLLARPELDVVSAVIADGPATVRMMRGDRGGAEGQGSRGAHLELKGAAGDLLSLLPVGGDAVGVTTGGLVYPLRDETLYMGQARGVSNVFEGGAAHVWQRGGLLLVIHTQSGPGSGIDTEHFFTDE
jgi:thiamine pyrophosphokinase